MSEVQTKLNNVRWLNGFIAIHSEEFLTINFQIPENETPNSGRRLSQLS